jgi:hypothetical protein
MAIQDDEAEQARVWDILYARLQGILRRFGKEDFIGRADYWIVDDNWGSKQHMLYINNLNLLAPAIVKLLQASLAEFPDWEIVTAVSLGDSSKSWPTMGLTIRAYEIVDDLKREYFPKEFQGIEYEGSRRGGL